MNNKEIFFLFLKLFLFFFLLLVFLNYLFTETFLYYVGTNYASLSHVKKNAELFSVRRHLKDGWEVSALLVRHFFGKLFMSSFNFSPFLMLHYLIYYFPFLNPLFFYFFLPLLLAIFSTFFICLKK